MNHVFSIHSSLLENQVLGIHARAYTLLVLWYVLDDRLTVKLTGASPNPLMLYT